MEWIAVNVAQQSLQIWVHRPDDVVALTCRLDAPDQLAAVVLCATDKYLTSGEGVTAICSGAGEAYVSVPAAPPGAAEAVKVDTGSDRLDLRVLPGMSQEKPAHIICGGETKVAGFIADYPEWDGVLCLVGDQTYWVHISAGEVVSFQSFLTGEMYSALAAASGLEGAAVDWDRLPFKAALSDAMSRPERAFGQIAGLRAEGKLHNVPSETLKTQLIGMLIGIELAAARPYWLGQNVALIGEGAFVEQYAVALKVQGVVAPCHDPDQMVLSGLRSAYELMLSKGIVT